jgi:hypothetical protein
VPFSGPLDLATVTEDTVLLYDIDPNSPEFGDLQPLDLGRGAYPLRLAEPRFVWPFETAWREYVTLLGPTVDAQPHWHADTNTLILRPMFPLRPGTRYAVVLTRALRDAEGQPVRSPLPTVNPPDQTGALEPLAQWVSGGRQNVAFAWTFVTASSPDTLARARAALYSDADAESSVGPVYGAFELPLEVAGLADGTMGEGDPRDHDWVVQAELIEALLEALAPLAQELGGARLNHVDYFVLTHLLSPDMRLGAYFPIVEKLQTNDVRRVPVLIAIPKPTSVRTAPYPVTLYLHGARRSRLEAALVANELAAAGVATAAFDAVGHGPYFGDLREALVRDAALRPESAVVEALARAEKLLSPGSAPERGGSIEERLARLEKNPLWDALFVQGRTVDLDGDGFAASGDGYLGGDPLATSGAVLQTAVDGMALVLALRRIDPSARNAPLQDVAGSREQIPAYLKRSDFNADGVPDLGGPDAALSALGQGIGGVHAVILAAMEPEVRTVVPVAAGGSIADMLERTAAAEFATAGLELAVGLTLVGCPVETDRGPELVLSWNLASAGCRDAGTSQWAAASANLPRLPHLAGMKLKLTNTRLQADPTSALLRSEASAEVSALEGFSLTVAASPGDGLELRATSRQGESIVEASVQAPRGGLGLLRNSPQLRNFLSWTQTALDRADPTAYARTLIAEPLVPESPKNVLLIAAAGDAVTPVSTSVTLARAVGLLGTEREDALALTKALVERGSLEPSGAFLPIDDPSGRGTAVGPLAEIATSAGRSGVRFVNTSRHDFFLRVDPDAPFDWTTYARQQAARFIATDGAQLPDGLCLEQARCDWLDAPAPE